LNEGFEGDPAVNDGSESKLNDITEYPGHIRPIDPGERVYDPVSFWDHSVVNTWRYDRFLLDNNYFFIVWLRSAVETRPFPLFVLIVRVASGPIAILLIISHAEIALFTCLIKFKLAAFDSW
jgi:hypothetical protein